jgi:hypothetical protein
MRTPSPQKCRLDLAPPLADRFIFGVAPIDYGPILLLMPFGPSTFSGPRGITPTFGYGAPHSSARGTLTLLSNVLLSAHFPEADFSIFIDKSIYLSRPSAWRAVRYAGEGDVAGSWRSSRRSLAINPRGKIFALAPKHCLRHFSS